MTRNFSIDKAKLIMEAGKFNNINEAILKFVNNCTEATVNSNIILCYHNRANIPNNCRGRSTGRSGYNTTYQRRQNGNNSNNNNKGLYNCENNNVRITYSGNGQNPLSEQEQI